MNKDPGVYITVSGNPIPKQSFRKGKNNYTPKRITDWQEIVGWKAKEAMSGRDIFVGNLKVQIYFRRKDKRRVDLDNLCKAVLDACNGIVWEDDNQIIELHLFKLIDKEDPGVGIRVDYFGGST